MHHLNLGTLLLPVLFLGWAVGASAAPFAYITNSGSDDVSVIDTATNTVVATVPVGDSPYGVAVTPDGTRVYVANNSSDTVSVIDTAINIVTATVQVGDGPRGVAVHPDGTRVYVANYTSNTVSVIDTATNAVMVTVPLGEGFPTGVAVHPDGTQVYVTNTGSDTVSVIDTATNTVTTTVPVGPGGHLLYGVAVNPAGTRVYVANWIGFGNTVSVIDTATNTVVATVPAGYGPYGVVVNPDGTRVYAPDWYSDAVSVIDTATNAVTATVPLLGEGFPTGVAVHPAGTRVYVANSPSDTVSVIDTATNTVTTTVPVGSYPVAFGQFIGPATADAVPFLSFPLDVTCQSIPCTPYTAKISSVQDHSVPTGYNCNSRGDCDGVVLAYNGEEGRKEYGENCPPPGYKKDASGTPFLVNVLNYVGAGCSPKYGLEAFRFPERFLNYDGHSGYDFPYGRVPILAAADGTLEVPTTDPINNPSGSSPHDTYNTLRIIHPNGYETWYLHAQEGSECVAFGICPNRPQPGDRVEVRAGQQIARVGDTGVKGNFHLHFEVRLGMDDVVDPYSENLWE